jgi:CRP-like cAMP-binding protein
VADLTDADIAAALERGRRAQVDEPRAKSVRYEPVRGQVVVELTNGASFAFPPALVKDLADADPVALADVVVLGVGYGLHWEALDLDLTVPGLIAEVFATRSHMARKAGQATSIAKAAAARANGVRGGRPRRSA